MINAINTFVPIVGFTRTEEGAKAPTASKRQSLEPVDTVSTEAVTQTEELAKQRSATLSEEREAEAQQLLEELSAGVVGFGTRLSIDVDKSAESFVYRSVDESTGEVRAQYPLEDTLKLRAFLRSLEGQVIDEEA